MKTKKDIRGEICKIISKMLDNPDKYGIYPTTTCYNELETLIKEVQEETRKEMKETTKQWYENHATNWEVNNLVDDLFGREFLLSITNKEKQ